MDKDIAEHLANFFKKEPYKITLWWFAKNPLLGNASPAEFYILRPEKFRKWFDNLVKGNIV